MTPCATVTDGVRPPADGFGPAARPDRPEAARAATGDSPARVFETSVDLHVHARPVDLHRAGAKRVGDRRAGRRAVAHVELALVQRALDLVVVEKAVAEPRLDVGAGVVGREDGVADGVERDVEAGHDDADHIVGRKLVGGKSVDPGDELLQRRGIGRSVRVNVPHGVSVGHILQSSDLIATVPERLADRLLGPFGLAKVAHPAKLPDTAINVFRHAKYHRSPAHRWLRGILFALFGDGSSGATRSD